MLAPSVPGPQKGFFVAAAQASQSAGLLQAGLQGVHAGPCEAVQPALLRL